MQTHINIEHRARDKHVNANVLLAFDYDKDEKRKNKKFQKTEIRDSEGVDFSFYFSEKYNLIHEQKKNLKLNKHPS